MKRAETEQIWSWVDRRAPELEDYLERHPDERARVQAVQQLMDGVGALAPVATPAQVGPYRLGRRLGEGGMGVVYEAEQDRPRRRVALKLLRTPGPASPEAALRLQREADALARLQHPGIAVVYATGETDGGVPYLAMELVAGLPLDVYAREQGLDRQASITLFLKLCAAVQHAHGAGLIHRDLKPQNILVTPQGEPKVLDFGLAQWRQPGEVSTLTATGALLGTLPYMSPEQVCAAGIGVASDIYALGVLLYELLLGQPPIDLEGLPVAEAARRIAEVPPHRPRALQPGLPADLEAVLLCALAKRPKARYASALDLAADVERAATKRPVNAKRWTLRRRARAWLGQHARGLRTAVQLLAIAALGGLAVWLLRPQLIAELLPGEYPKLAPFEAVRFHGPTPEVRVSGRWFELLEIEGHSSRQLVIEFIERRPRSWRKRFAEDLWQYLWETGRVPSREVDLLLRDLESWATELHRNVPMTGAKRRSSWTYRRGLLENCVELDGQGVWLPLADGRLAVQTIGTIDAQALRRAVEAAGLPYVPTLRELLTVKEGHRAGQPVRVVGRPASGDKLQELWFDADSSDLHHLRLPRAALDGLYAQARAR